MRLLLLRHAKAVRPESEDADDHERALSARGQKAAPLIGAYMREKGYEPALVLCSTSLRTRETLDLLLPLFKTKPKLRYERALYLAEWTKLLERVRKAAANATPLLLIGHNPGLEQLAIALALQPEGAAEKARAQRLAQKFPTAALAVLDFEAKTWREAKPGLGRLADYMRPKDLSADEGGGK